MQVAPLHLLWSQANASVLLFPSGMAAREKSPLHVAVGFPTQHTVPDLPLAMPSGYATVHEKLVYFRSTLRANRSEMHVAPLISLQENCQLLLVYMVLCNVHGGEKI